MVKLFSTILAPRTRWRPCPRYPGRKTGDCGRGYRLPRRRDESEGDWRGARCCFVSTPTIWLWRAPIIRCPSRDPDRPDPRLHVRGAIGNGLVARIDRALYYEIVEMALAEGGDPPAIWSNGACFPLVDR